MRNLREENKAIAARQAVKILKVDRYGRYPLAKYSDVARSSSALVIRGGRPS